MAQEPRTAGPDVAQEPPGDPVATTEAPTTLRAIQGEARAVSRGTCRGFPVAGICEATAGVRGYCRGCYYRMRSHAIRAGEWFGQVRRPHHHLDPVERSALAALRAYRKHRGTWPNGETMLGLLRSREDKKILARGLRGLMRKGIIDYQLVPVGLERR